MTNLDKLREKIQGLGVDADDAIGVLLKNWGEMPDNELDKFIGSKLDHIDSFESLIAEIVNSTPKDLFER